MMRTMQLPQNFKLRPRFSKKLRNMLEISVAKESAGESTHYLLNFVNDYLKFKFQLLFHIFVIIFK